MMIKNAAAKPLFSPLTAGRIDFFYVLGAALLAPILFMACLFLIPGLGYFADGGFLSGVVEAAWIGVIGALVIPSALLSKRFGWRGASIAGTAGAIVGAGFFGMNNFSPDEGSEVSGWILILSIVPVYFLVYYLLRRASAWKSVVIFGLSVILALAALWFALSIPASILD